MFLGRDVTVTRAPFHGMSGSVFYQVDDAQTHETLFLAKVFPEERSYEFLDEFHSLQTYRERGLPCPEILRVALIVEGGEKLGVILEKKVPGQTLRTHLDGFTSCAQEDERAEKLEALSQVFASFGASFAQFHSMGGTSLKPLDPCVKAHFVGIVEDAINPTLRGTLVHV